MILIQILILSFAIKETGNERVHPLAKIGSKTKQRPKLLFQPVTHYCPLFYYFLICFTASSRRQVIYHFPTLKQQSVTDSRGGWDASFCFPDFLQLAPVKKARPGQCVLCGWWTLSPCSAAPAPLKSRLSIQKIPPCIAKSREV